MEDVSSKIFVGGLPASTSNESLMVHFAPYSPMDATVQMDRLTGRSRGFGFVVFPTIELAQAALSVPQTIDGKVVECKACVSKEDARRGGMVATRGPGGMFNTGGGPGGGCYGGCGASSAPSYQDVGSFNAGGGGPPPRVLANKLFVGGLAPTTTSDTMNAYFSQFGVADCLVMMDRATQRSRGFGFVTFTTSDGVKLALSSGQNANGRTAEHVIDGKVVSVRICEDRERGPPPFQSQGYGAQASPLAPAPGGGDFALDAGALASALQALTSALTGAASPGPVQAPPPSPRPFAPASGLGGPPPHLTAAVLNRVFVGGLPQTCDDAKLHTFFSQFGPLTDAKVMFDRHTGRSRGFGYVSFLEFAGMEAALLNAGANIIDDKRVEVKRCEERGSPVLQGRERPLGSPAPGFDGGGGGALDALGSALSLLQQLGGQPAAPQPAPVQPPQPLLQPILPHQAAQQQQQQHQAPDAASSLLQLASLLQSAAAPPPPQPSSPIGDLAASLAQLSSLLAPPPAPAPAPIAPAAGTDLLSQVTKMLQDPQALLAALLSPVTQQLAGAGQSGPAQLQESHYGAQGHHLGSGGGGRYGPY